MMDIERLNSVEVKIGEHGIKLENLEDKIGKETESINQTIKLAHFEIFEKIDKKFDDVFTRMDGKINEANLKADSAINEVALARKVVLTLTFIIAWMTDTFSKIKGWF